MYREANGLYIMWNLRSVEFKHVSINPRDTGKSIWMLGRVSTEKNLYGCGKLLS